MADDRRDLAGVPPSRMPRCGNCGHAYLRHVSAFEKEPGRCLYRLCRCRAYIPAARCGRHPTLDLAGPPPRRWRLSPAAIAALTILAVLAVGAVCQLIASWCGC